MRFPTGFVLLVALLAPMAGFAQTESTTQIAFRNGTEVPQVFSIDGTVVCTSNPWTACTVHVPPGEHMLKAVYISTTVSNEEKVTLKAGEAYPWMVMVPRPLRSVEELNTTDRARLVVTNATELQVHIYMNGGDAFCTMNGRNDESCKDVVMRPGRHVIVARDLENTVVEQRRVTFKRGDIYNWVVGE